MQAWISSAVPTNSVNDSKPTYELDNSINDSCQLIHVFTGRSDCQEKAYLAVHLLESLHGMRPIQNQHILHRKRKIFQFLQKNWRRNIKELEIQRSSQKNDICREGLDQVASSLYGPFLDCSWKELGGKVDGHIKPWSWGFPSQYYYAPSALKQSSSFRDIWWEVSTVSVQQNK